MNQGYSRGEQQLLEVRRPGIESAELWGCPFPRKKKMVFPNGHCGRQYLFCGIIIRLAGRGIDGPSMQASPIITHRTARPDRPKHVYSY